MQYACSAYLSAFMLMKYQPEHIRLFLFEEDASFRGFIEGLLQFQGYRHIHKLDNPEHAHLVLEENTNIGACLIGLNSESSKQNGFTLASLIRARAEFIPLIFLSKIYNEEVYVLCRHLLPSAFLNKELSDFKLQIALEQAFLHRHRAERILLEKEQQFPFHAPALFFKTAEGFIAIPEHQIIYFQSNQKITLAKTFQQIYQTQIQLQTLENALQEHFIRIHKSYLINVRHIEAIQPNESSLFIGGETLPIGYAYRKAFFNRIKLLR
jgi:DNA-binding LytR/AlgR family response regulator